MSGSKTMPVVEGFTLNSQIGRGGFARVYHATQHSLQRPVAIKILENAFSNEEQQRQFRRECKVMGQLSRHEGIVTVFQATETDDGRAAIVMELYDGTLDKRDRLNVQQVVDVGIRVADALATIHAKGIIHRDIKPHNIFVPVEGRAVAVGDFGISSIQVEETSTGGGGFSVDYSAPEVFNEGGGKKAADIYALGATLHQLATGEVPFPTKPGEDLGTRVRRIVLQPVPSLGPGFPADLAWVVKAALAKNPSDRPSSAAEMATQLRRVQSEIGPPSTPIPPVQTDSRQPAPERLDEPISSTVYRGKADHGLSERIQESPDYKRPVEPDPPPDPERKRRFLVSGGVIAGLALVGLAVGTLTNLGGDDPSPDSQASTATQTIAATSGPASNFVVLVPPADLEAKALTPTRFSVSWSVDDETVSYQVHHVESKTNEFVDAPPYEWDFDEAQTNACFEVRTVSETGDRVSQSAAGPACASYP